MTRPPTPRLAHAGSPKPRLRMQKIKLAGRSAFPPNSATAFGGPDPVGAGSGQAFPAPVPGAAGPGMGDQ